jgi:hypothetical protein
MQDYLSIWLILQAKNRRLHLADLYGFGRCAMRTYARNLAFEVLEKTYNMWESSLN